MTFHYAAPALAAVALASAIWSPAEADTVTLNPIQDATLYEQAEGTLANGAGQYLFAGRTSTPRTRRALLSFDIANAVPAGATVTSVTLTLNMSKTVAVTHAHSLHRVLRAWGEGGADDAADEGDGTAAAGGDATWLHTFSDNITWQTAGGDFDASASATTSVGALGVYSWSSTGLVADVQTWLDQPTTNFGWMLLGDETGGRTAKRFDSRQHATSSKRPVLTVGFGVYSTATDFDLSGAVDFDDFFAFADHFGRSSTDGQWDTRFDLSPNGAVDFDDFFVFADDFGLVRDSP